MKPTPLLYLLIGWTVWFAASVSEAQDIEAANAAPIFVSAVGTPAGLKAYTPGHWGVASVVIGNRTQTPQVVLATVRVRGWEELRFSREVLVPARSVRQTTIPIHLPEGLPEDSKLEILGRVADERVAKAEFEGVTDLVSSSDTAFLQDQTVSFNNLDNSVDFAYEAAIAARAASRLKRTMMLIDDRMLPSTYHAWDAVGNVIVSGDRLAENSAARQSLREWLHKGGRMWIQADQTSLETIRLLLGSALSIELVDQVALHDFSFEYAEKDSKGEPTAVQLEDPVTFKRVIVAGAEVLYEIDGWPALIKVDVGRGQVYLTMLESRGLVRGRLSEDPPAENETFYTHYVALEPLQQLAFGLRAGEVAAAVPEEVRAEYVTQRIGYKIPPRKFVINVLLGFCGLIGMAGLGLNYVGLREHLLWVTLVAASLATATVVAVGLRSHHDVPPTASSFQVMKVLPEMNELATTGSIATYQSQIGPVAVSSDTSTRMDPQSARLRGKIRNFVWSDAGHWRWDNTVMPAGVQLFDFHRYETLPRPVSAIASFGPEGLSGMVTLAGVLKGHDSAAGDEPALSDVILVFPQFSPLAASLDSRGEFSAGIEDVLPVNEFFSSTFVDTAQRQRRALYQAWYDRYLEGLDQTSYLLGWSDSIDSGLNWGEDVSAIDGTLLAIPLTFQQTAPETRVSVPGSTMTAQAVTSQSGQSNTFDNSTGRWSYPIGRSTRTRLRFQLPADVLPLRVESAQLFIDCNVPSRRLTIEVIDGQQRRMILNRANQSGKFTFDLASPAPPALDAEGGMTLEFTVGELANATTQAERASGTWAIRTTRLDVTGTTTQPAEVESPR